MSLMHALLTTYDSALDKGLVDKRQPGMGGLTLLPVYHSNKKVASNEDVFEITLDNDSNAIGGQFLSKDEMIVFPITEDSITRSGSKIAPHAISDELSYLAQGNDVEKNKVYLEGIKELLKYEAINPCENARVIGEYILKNTILEDFIEYHLGNKAHKLDQKKFKLGYEITDAKGKIIAKELDLKKIFITFKIEKEHTADMTVTNDVGLHEFYINYIRHKNSQHQGLTYCDITGKLDYCIERHRGIIGNAKLISISNNDETYYGRFKKGDEIYHVSYEASQKVHNMLKYLLDNSKHSKFIGEGAYLLNWLSQDLDRGGIGLLAELNDEDFYFGPRPKMEDLGGDSSMKIGEYFFGQNGELDSIGDFYVLIIEKISNGRVSVKYFRQLSKSDAYERIQKWYESTNWKFFNKIKSPTPYEIVNFVYGMENSKGFLSCENKQLSRSTVERLVPCIIDSQKLPRDIARRAFYKLSNKHSYKKSWNSALSIGSALIKKYKNDYENYLINPDNIGEVEQMKESRSFYYGRLAAIYEKIEIDAMQRGKDDESEGKTGRVTNMDRLWGSFIRTPERTRSILENVKLRPYMNILKKSKPQFYMGYDRSIKEITLELIRLEELQGQKGTPLNEDFIMGYYYQKNELYTPKDKKKEDLS